MATYPIYQFYAELFDYKPKMWRRFQVTNNVSMARFGYIIMTMFEMKASHLFCFDVPHEENLKTEMLKKLSESEYLNIWGDSSYSSPEDQNWHIEIISDESYEYRDSESEKLIDAVKTKLKHVIRYCDDRMLFKYDFGDNWQVSIVLEKIINDKELPGKELPRVLGGEGYGIVEDCGGTQGLEDIAKIFKKKKGEKYEEYCEWLGVDELDLNSFDINDMNFRLKRIPRIYSEIYELELDPSKQSIDFLERRYKKNI